MSFGYNLHVTLQKRVKQTTKQNKLGKTVVTLPLYETGGSQPISRNTDNNDVRLVDEQKRANERSFLSTVH